MSDDPVSAPDWPAAPTQPSSGDVEFLHREFDHLAASYRSNEESGERRVTLLVALIGAIATAFGFAARSLDLDNEDLAWSIGFVATLLLVFSFLVFWRTIGRNVHTDELLDGMHRIRAYHLQQNPELVSVLAFIPPANPKRRMRRETDEQKHERNAARTKRKATRKEETEAQKRARKVEERRAHFWGVGNAGVLQSVVLLNALLAGSTVAGFVAALTDAGWALLAGVGLVCAAAVWTGLLYVARERYANRYEELDQARTKAMNRWRDDAIADCWALDGQASDEAQ